MLKNSAAHKLALPEQPPPVLQGHLNLGGTNQRGQSIQVTSYYVLFDGQPRIPVMGEYHFSRYLPRYWEEELLKMRAGGVDVVASYVFWNHIEEDEGFFDWTHQRNLRQFVTLCGRHNIPALVRIGPFAHGECRNGGLPDWLYGRPFPVRSNDARYLFYVRRLYQAISEQLNGLLFKDSGPVIGIQLENEYMHCGAPWETPFRKGTEYVPGGSDGPEHMAVLKRIAVEVGLDVPLYTCTGWLNSPVVEGEMLPMQGGYAFTPWSPDPDYRQAPTREFLFMDRHLNPVLNGPATYDAARYPYACCEIGGGIQDTYYHRNQVPPEAVEAQALVNLGNGANLVGYYMYHGGSHPVGKHSYMNEFTVPRISYDFQAPLREFGQFAASYRYLRLLHLFLRDFGDQLAPMTVVLPDNAPTIQPDDTTTLRYAARTKDGAGFLFLSNYQDHVNTQDIPDICFEIDGPAGMLSFPLGEPLRLQKNVCAILPFGLSLDGVHLYYATAQLLTKIDEAHAVTYVFFAPRGMHSEYSFDPATYRSLTVSGGELSEVDSRVYTSVEPSMSCLITLTAADGKTVRILTLTRDQAENCTREMLWHQERLIITESIPVMADDELYLYSLNQADVQMSIYPAVDDHLATPFGLFAESADGCFTRYSATIPAKAIQLDVEAIGADKAVIRLPSDCLDGVDNVFLRFHYTGDIGSAYIDGKLVSDNFNNGTPWEIGVKQIDGLPEKDLFVAITPVVRQGGIRGFVPTGMAFRLEAGEDRIAELDSISAIPQYRIPVTRYTG